MDLAAWVEETTPAVLSEALLAHGHDDDDDDGEEDEELRAIHIYRVQ